MSLKNSVICLACAFFITSFSACDSNSCEGELPGATIESNSFSVSSNRVWVTLNHESGQTFQVQDVTEDNPKTLASLPTGQYSVSATVTKSTGTNTIRLNVRMENCVDYKVFVNATGLSMSIGGEER